jgi:hypothetical protein
MVAMEKRIQRVREQLPAYAMRTTIVQTVIDAQVTVISGTVAWLRGVGVLCSDKTQPSGATGCGKSTQVGQLVLDDLIDRGVAATARILLTQPRRVAALSLAQRVAGPPPFYLIYHHHCHLCEIGRRARGDSRSDGRVQYPRRVPQRRADQAAVLHHGRRAADAYRPQRTEIVPPDFHSSGNLG